MVERQHRIRIHSGSLAQVFPEPQLHELAPGPAVRQWTLPVLRDSVEPDRGTLWPRRSGPVDLNEAAYFVRWCLLTRNACSTWFTNPDPTETRRAAVVVTGLDPVQNPP